MNDTAVRMWRAAADGYRERSRDVSFDLAAADDELDGLAAGLVEETMDAGSEPRVAAEVALLARFYERSGDHAVNLARRVDAMVAPRRITSARLVARRPRPGADDGGTGLRRLLGPLRRLRIVPTDEVFFEMFQAAADNARDCAEELRKMVASFDAIDIHFQNVKRFERRGDQITRDLLHKLDSSFVTPYDREDIHALGEKIDDVVDDVFAVAELIELVQVDRALPEFPELADVLVAMAAEMVELIGCLRSKTGARYRLERIEALERDGDAVYRRLMARLFSGDYEALDVLRWKDIVQALEDSLNAIEDVSDVVESILVKSS
jgi:predicted phosphate transport protein (TIGR00153 family)